MALQRGDNDNKKKWGGRRLNRSPNYSVRDFQTELKAIGTYTSRVDGDFGKKTERALKITQWCLTNSTRVLSKGNRIRLTPNKKVSVTGKLESKAQAIIHHWSQIGYQVTGDLVRMETGSLQHVQLSSVFKNIGQQQVGNTEFLISDAAAGMVELMNATAEHLGLIISLNQVFRIHGAKVTGAVVPPASKSQHLIGHAVDCNIIDGGRWNTSKDFRSNKQTDGARAFIKIMKANGFRWGGNFSKKDTPHFDAQLNARQFDYDAKFFLNQRQLATAEPIGL